MLTAETNHLTKRQDAYNLGFDLYGSVNLIDRPTANGGYLTITAAMPDGKKASVFS